MLIICHFLFVRQKRPTTEAKETNYRGKRDLPQWRNCPFVNNLPLFVFVLETSHCQTFVAATGPPVLGF